MQFQLGKKYWYETPTNISFTLLKQLEEEGKKPYKLISTYEVIKRTNCFVTLKKIGSNTILKRKIKIYNNIEECCIAEFHHATSFLQTIKANRLCEEE
mgnify:CR=1 FL=1|tara:strand:- start:392 stop:685 length:294 start_codon:yes stop_codon:yes gene_type:complete